MAEDFTSSRTVNQGTRCLAGGAGTMGLRAPAAFMLPAFESDIGADAVQDSDRSKETAGLLRAFDAASQSATARQQTGTGGPLWDCQ